MVEPLAIDTGWMGSRELIVTWLVPHQHGWMLIETGPQKTAEVVWRQIQEVLEREGGTLTDILVTHIHLDHSGAAGWLQQQSGARLHVHPRGAKHLIDPSRIIAGARQVFGPAFDQLWDEPVPAAGEVVTHQDDERFDIGGRRLRWLDTPGHAWHHAAILDEDAGLVFTGDVAGVRLHARPETVRLPSVPADFDEAAWSSSIERLRAIGPETVALTHGGRYDDAPEHLAAAADVLRAQVAAARSENPDAAMRRLFDARLQQAGVEDPTIATRFEMIMSTPLCVRGITMADARAARRD